MQQTLLSVDEVAAALSISKSTVWRLNQHGQIPRPIKLGGSTRWQKSDIEAHLESLSILTRHHADDAAATVALIEEVSK